VRGYFYSAKKTNSNSLPSTNQNEKSVELCTVNNQIESNEDSYRLIQTNSQGFNKYKIFIVSLIFLICAVFFLLDMMSHFRHIEDENLIQKFQCEKEFYENECDKITVEDGPIINNFCKEKEICMNIQYSNVYFHSVLIKYLTEIASSVTPTTWLSKIFVTIFLILALYIIRKILN